MRVYPIPEKAGLGVSGGKFIVDWREEINCNIFLQEFSCVYETLKWLKPRWIRTSLIVKDHSKAEMEIKNIRSLAEGGWAHGYVTVKADYSRKVEGGNASHSIANGLTLHN